MRVISVEKAAVACGLPPDATAEQVLTRPRRLGREARAERVAKAEALVATALAFESAEADGVDTESARLHVRAEQCLAERGKKPGAYTAEEYAQACDAVAPEPEYTAVGFAAETSPPPEATPGEPLLRIDPDPNLHTMILAVLHETGVVRQSKSGLVGQGQYDAARPEALRRLGRSS